jgi:2'-5' RNA ligase
VHGPVCLKTTHFGAFPKFAKPKVLWAGVDDCDDSGKLREMARCCRRAGHATVRKSSAKEAPFKGHITLARAREFAAPIGVDTVAQMQPLPELEWVADSLVLYQSTLHPDGAKYRKLEAFNFEGKRYVR